MRLQPPRLLATTLAVTLALAGALLGSTGRAAAAPPSPDARSEHQRIVDFWTPDRIAQAVPRDFVRDPATGRFSLQPNRAPGSTTTSTGVLGAVWTSGGLVQTTTGKVFFAMGTSYYVCSGSVVKDADTSTSVVLTAGHCAWDNSTATDPAQHWAKNWMFIPDYADKPATLTADGSFCASTAYGCWTAQALTVDQAFTQQTSYNTTATLNDFAFATVGPGGLGGTSQLDTKVGAQAISFSSPVPSGTRVDLFGYPAAKKYNGSQLIYSEGPLGTDPNNGNLTYRVASSMTGGSSGGPWFAPFSAGVGTLMSLNSYGYAGQSYMQGPMFTNKTQSLYTDAQGATANHIVP
ncbi:trypsin-like serine peptidase [Raineyella fluvialis]|uniref:V8-like Glu-specific endopeptidase n=1 Tax=Raineyella fluvialis TaxID=2662261 RepID=A0A5Q2F8X4_9ACTN|nr:trypsin-like peptidase domain-containing protein [Raineyella fluvialis]QGF23289.1 hypothetical protein Rai3103_05990 [Raineyella fluvialis]